MNNKIIIFSEFAECCKVLLRELVQYNPVMIIGETPDKERQKIVEQFNTDPSVKICILSSAGQFGLNLQVANIIINYDLPFSLSKLDQRVGRAHRIRQKNKVFVYNLLGKGTADMAIKKIIHAKAELSADLLGDIPIGMDTIKEILEYE